MKKIIIAGGSGFIGQLLTNHFVSKGYSVVILTRKPNTQANQEHVEFVHWDGKSPGDWCAALEGAETLINLTGKSVDCRYTKKNKRIILESRVNATMALGQAIRKLENPPNLWINAASATIYRHSLDTPMTEKNGELGTGFSVDVCKAWEHSFFQSEVAKTRKVGLRMAFVIGKKGGPFKVLKRHTLLGLGGPFGKGDQMVSWLHEHDLNSIVEWVMEHKHAEGIYNCSSPPL